MKSSSTYKGASAPFFTRANPPDRIFNEADCFTWQRKALKQALDHLRYIVNAMPGSGKTLAAALWAAKLIDQGKAHRVAIVAPDIVLEDAWLDQLSAIEETMGLDMLPAHRYSGERREKLWSAKQGHIVTVTPDTLFKFATAQQKAGELWVDALIADEGHMFRNFKTNRSKAFCAMARTMPTLFLTGTLLPNGPLDAWVPGHIANGGKGFFGKDFWRWRAENFYKQGPYKWVPNRGVTEKVQQALEGVAISVDVDRAESGVPQELYSRRRFEFSAEHRQRIVDFANERRVDTPWGELRYEESEDSAFLHKLRQLSSGYISLDGEYHLFDDARLKALADIVESVEGPVLVPTHYRAEIALIRSKFGKGVEVLNGETPNIVRPTIINLFNEGWCKILACHPAAMGHGIHLGKGNARTICWFSGGFDYAQRIQTNARLVRTGQRHVVSIIELFSPTGIDAALASVVKRKGATEADVLRSLRGSYVR